MRRSKENVPNTAAAPSNSRNRTIRMSDEEWDALRIEAIKRRTTVSELIIEAVKGRMTNIYPSKK